MKHTEEYMIPTGELRYYKTAVGEWQLQQEWRYNEHREWRIIPHVECVREEEKKDES